MKQSGITSSLDDAARQRASELVVEARAQEIASKELSAPKPPAVGRRVAVAPVESVASHALTDARLIFGLHVDMGAPTFEPPAGVSAFQEYHLIVDRLPAADFGSADAVARLNAAFGDSSWRELLSLRFEDHPERGQARLAAALIAAKRADDSNPGSIDPELTGVARTEAAFARALKKPKPATTAASLKADARAPKKRQTLAEVNADFKALFKR